MAILVVSDEIAARLNQIAERENKTINEVLEMLIERYTSKDSTPQLAIYTPFGGEATASEMLDYLIQKRENKSVVHLTHEEYESANII